MVPPPPKPLDVYPSLGYGPFEEIVEWDQGEVDFFPNPLDWMLRCDEDEDPTLALLDAIEENFHREVKVAQPKSKGKRELFNLKSFVASQYDSTSIVACQKQ
jgi:hypothetical protein